MKQDNKLKNPMAGATISEQNTAMEQIAAAKLKQREQARARAAGSHPRKSMSAAAVTPEQSEVAQKPPQLYQVERINIPADFPEVARLIFRELTKVQQSQSVILNLWQKLRGQVADVDGITFDLPVEFSGGVTIGGKAGFNIIPDTMPSGSTTFDDTHWGWCLMATNAAEHPGTWDGYGCCLTYSMQGTKGYATPLDYINAMKGGSNCWVIQEATDTHGTKWVRAWVNAGPWAAWQKITTTADPITP